jgi:hypothetical protein
MVISILTFKLDDLNTNVNYLEDNLLFLRPPQFAASTPRSPLRNTGNGYFKVRQTRLVSKQLRLPWK